MDLFLFDCDIQESNAKPGEIVQGKKRLRHPNREQIEFKVSCIDDLISEDHRVRDVWEYTSKIDLSDFCNTIKIIEGCGGPPVMDPRVLFALWLYGILEKVASARQIARLCKEHHAFIWLCGGLSINYHSLSDFRTKHSDKFRKLLQESIALIWKAGVFHPEEAAQDGTRVKANAGTKSLRREKTLLELLEKATEHIDQLEQEIVTNPSASSEREKSAKKRAAEERKSRLEEAINEMEKYKKQRIATCKENHKKNLSQEDLNNMRASTTDPQCRKMKMGDGGFRPAFNVQFATSSHMGVILGVETVNTLDPGTLASMMEVVKETLKKIGCPMPSRWLADSAYANKDDAEQAETKFPETTLYAPPTSTQKNDAFTPRKTDNTAMKNLRTRMKDEEAKIIYKKRCSTAEFSNAVSKNRGMREFLVRGLEKAQNMAVLYAIVHNMTICIKNNFFNN